MKTLLLIVLFVSNSEGASISEQVVSRAQVVNTIREVSVRVGVPVELMLAVAWVESSHRANLPTVLDGATPSYGVFQIKLETAQWVDEVYGHSNPITVKRLTNVYINSFYASKYMKLLLKRYNNDWRKAADAYNKGHVVSTNSAYVKKVLSKVKEQQ